MEMLKDLQENSEQWMEGYENKGGGRRKQAKVM